MTPQPPLRLTVIVASVRTGRLAVPILTWTSSILNTRDDFTVDVIDLADVALPLAAAGNHTPSPISNRLAAADAFLILTPEYNHSIPAALKNAIDWHAEEWVRKPASIVAYGAESGGLRAIEHLRLIFPELQAMTTRNNVTLANPWNHLDADSRFTAGDRHLSALGATLDELHWWARALQRARAESTQISVGAE